MDGEHDHDRIGAREMLHFAGRAIAPPAAFNERCRGSAIRAEAMPRMPIEQRLSLGERRQVVGDEEANKLLRRPYRQPWVHPEPSAT